MTSAGRSTPSCREFRRILDMPEECSKKGFQKIPKKGRSVGYATRKTGGVRLTSSSTQRTPDYTSRLSSLACCYKSCFLGTTYIHQTRSPSDNTSCTHENLQRSGLIWAKKFAIWTTEFFTPSSRIFNSAP